MRMHLVHLCQEEIRVVEVSIDEISFVLNLYSDGYFILKALENDDGDHSALQDGLKLLRPYDRNSDGLFAVCWH
ncbi:hypothetical protein RND81_01G091500 [Saponaria officinalis]|uniref:Uncharacterized protein n=1 Tax=Saponaria officinalis TaxID=3572 RepID=A0AAW1NDP7_SAPOF